MKKKPQNKPEVCFRFLEATVGSSTSPSEEKGEPETQEEGEGEERESKESVEEERELEVDK